MAELVKNLRTVWESWVHPWVGRSPWRRERPPTPVFWPGEFHGLYSPWGCKELTLKGASLVSQPVKNLPAMQETLVRFLGQEDLLEKG